MDIADRGATGRWKRWKEIQSIQRERKKERDIGADQTHFHSHHGQLLADTQAQVGSKAFCMLQNLHFKVKSHAFQIQMSVLLLSRLM